MTLVVVQLSSLTTMVGRMSIIFEIPIELTSFLGGYDADTET